MFKEIKSCFATLSSVVAVFLLFFFLDSRSVDVKNSMTAISLILGLTTLFLPLIAIFSILFLISPFQQLSFQISSRIFNFLKNDGRIVFCSLSLIVFFFLSLAFAFRTALYDYDFFPLFLFWMIFLGIVIDLFRFSYNRLIDYLDPYSLIQFFSNQAQSAFGKKEERVYIGIEALNEIAIKGLKNYNLALSSSAVDQIPKITSGYVVSKKREKEEITHFLFYIFDRLESLSEIALGEKLSAFSSHLINILGKMVIVLSRFDLSLAVYPLHFIGKFTHQAFELKIKEVPIKSALTLVEVARLLLEEIEKESNPSKPFKELFLSLIHHLEKFSKETFRQEKTTSIKILSQPFYDLKALFGNEKMTVYHDTALVLHDLDRVIADFDTLQEVLRTMPTTKSEYTG